ncbi:MFS transporter [Caldivirga maquilingensis]|uniref:Major facilitator superfamily MFS_1 n=1 Tax=Caldivirga maquilingensis (strain ATCC 700844 / DSM 13496 / JCM 10307 / IC-167) TaxID=397948 RepID=A8MB84_CALMQ|nr:MFS transporter [Caldivirga maquilingensis]ABW01174.1 major facilitator superfamily MFS_1 [Caldivirga maquilingensis IC-167]
MTNDHWGEAHTVAFTVFSLSTTIEAYIYSISYLATGWVVTPRYLTALLTVWPPLWLLIGGAVAGPLSDALGRRRVLYLTLLMYVVGAVGLMISQGYVMLLIFLSLLLVATGGEYNTVMTAAHEYFPSRLRGRLVFLILNFTNLGGVLAAALTLLNVNPMMQRVALGATLIIILPLLYALRRMLPESVLWLEAVGKVNEVNTIDSPHEYTVRIRLPPTWLRVMVGGLIGWAYTAGFSLLALTLGPYFLPSLTNWLILVFSTAALVSGVVIGLLADSVSRRVMLAASSLGSTLITLILAFTTNTWMRNLGVFWGLFTVFSILINAYFLTEDTLKSEYWRVIRRGTYTALVRVISLGGSIPVLFASAYIPMKLYLLVDSIILGVGAAASIVWYIVGVETGKGISVRAWGLEDA